MSKFHLKCSECQREQVPQAAIGLCDTCQSPYDVVYADDSNSVGQLPLANHNAKNELKTAPTPIVELPRIANLLGIKKLYAKLEYCSLTGSFKDRGSAVLIAGAVEDGVTEFIEDSSGNAGVSLAAFAARAGIKAKIFLPSSVSKNKLIPIQMCGADVELVDGPRQAANDRALAVAKQQNITFLSHNYSPYFVEGMKSFAYELNSDLVNELDALLFPVGNGSLLLGTWLGLKERFKQAQIAKIPALCGIQAENVCPIHIEFNQLKNFTQTFKTVAAGIAVSQPVRLKQVVRTMQSTDGQSAAVAEKSILHWQRRLAELEGIFCEATAAAPIAGIETLLKQGVKLTRVLIPITGSGLKEVAH